MTDVNAFRTAALVAVTNAWWAGRRSPDDVVAVVGAAEVEAAPGPEPVLLALARMRAAGAPALLLALPRPGDPAEVQADPEVIAAACSAGAIAVTAGTAAAGLLPTASGWRIVEAGVRSWPEPTAARRDLLEAVAAAGESIANLDLGRDVPNAARDIESRLAELNSFVKLLEPRAAELAERSARVIAMLELAASTEPTALSGNWASSSASILGRLSDLANSARAGLAAAVNDTARALVAR